MHPWGDLKNIDGLQWSALVTVFGAQSTIRAGIGGGGGARGGEGVICCILIHLGERLASRRLTNGSLEVVSRETEADAESLCLPSLYHATERDRYSGWRVLGRLSGPKPHPGCRRVLSAEHQNT